MEKRQVRPSTATAKAETEFQKKKKPSKMLTYKDYTVREENGGLKQLLTPKTAHQNFLRTTASSRPHTASAVDSYQFKQRVEQKFQNFIQKREVIDDDDSLLQDSQKSREKSEKQQILELQKAQRRRAAQEKKRIELEKTQKVKDGLDELNRKVRQNIKNQTKRERQSKSRERSRERSLKKRNAELVKKHAPDRSGSRQGAAAQLQDLKSWIEEQMHTDGVDDSNLESEDKDDVVRKNKENTSHNTVLSLKEVGVTSEQQKLKILKHQLPGNHLLSEKEESKLGVRQNRYGVFETGQSEFEKVVEIQREKLSPKKEEVQKQQISQADQQKSKEHVRDLIMQLAQRSGIALQSQAKPVPTDTKLAAPKPKDDLSEDSCDKVPVRQSDKSKISRSIHNVKASEPKLSSSILPGVTDTRKKQEALDKAQKEKEAKATLVIQKFLRGHWGRREAARQLYRRKNDIEEEYSRFEREYKNSQGYNLKQYVRDKQKIRQKNGFDSMDEIAEAIGESSSTTTAHIVQSSVKMQNFFKFGQQATDFDPLSLISIYAKRHSKAPEQKLKAEKTQKSTKRPAKDKVTASSSIIEEDIYSEDFDNEIPEDIQKASSSASTIPKPKRPATKNNNRALIESDSIVDEAPSAAISKSDSIVDEVGAASKDNSDVESSIKEESIIRNEFDSDNYKISNAKKQLEARTRVTYGMNSENMVGVPQQRQQILLEIEEQKKSDKIRSENLVGQLLSQMREFESAALSQTMMDRMEKIVTSSLAQKDQIIMAQRLAELERENRHKEEINRIREEQIRLMSQLMLLGNVGATQNQRDEIISSIRSIAEQPIVIREQPVIAQHQASMPVPLTHQQLYQQNKKTKVTYLDEYDQSKKSNKFSSGQYSDIKDSKQVSAKERELRDDLSDDIVDEVGSVKSDSIAEEIEESLDKSTSGSYEEYKNRQYKLVQGSKVLLATYVSDIEKAIIRQKDQKEQVLNSRLRQKKLSPRSYQRKRADLEDWANRERREVKDNHSVLLRKQQLADDASKKLESKTIVEESNDSDQVKKAIYQANLLDKGIIGVSPDQRYIQRKKEAAEQLMQEKEKVIQEQLNSKIRNLEKELADEVLQQALEIDVEKEVERRFQAVRRQLEDSVGVESARSGVSQSRDSASKQKKVVKFQEQEKQKQHQIDASNGIEESIDEVINSGSYSQSFKSSSVIESKSKSLPVSQPTSFHDPKPTSPIIAKPTTKNQSAAIEQSESIAEQISDNYTDDFSEGGASESKNNLEQSKTRLQSKAKELTESAAYSEDGFDEESIGQSSSAVGNVATQAAAAKKMESVLEESIDESGVRSKTSSRLESTNQFQQSEVPSEDQEVHGSVQSVDWQIQIPQESARTGQDFEKESIREDSSLDRDENDDQFESNPEDIGRSASMSNDDLLAKADYIAQNLLDQILKEYKDDNSYIVSCEKKQIDEDAFRDKFPYTLDVKPIEPEMRPLVLSQQNSARSSASSPAKKVKTAKELQDEVFLKKHDKEQEILKQQHKRVADYLNFVISKIDMPELIRTLDTPIELNPLAVLAQIQAYEDEEPPRLESQPEQQQVLPQTFFVKIDKEYHNLQRQNKGGQPRSPNAAEKQQESLTNVHNYALFEAFNEALDQRRPYKNKGQPMPWSKNTRVAKQETTLEEAKTIVQQASNRVLEWSKTGAGSKYAPLPLPPTQTQDEFGEEIVQPPLQDGEEDRKNQQRQEKLGQLMTQDIQETDNLWTDYEVEDTQVRFDLADMILADLASEIAALLQ